MDKRGLLKLRRRYSSMPARRNATPQRALPTLDFEPREKTKTMAAKIHASRFTVAWLIIASDLANAA
jgi:hypothetical protein